MRKLLVFNNITLDGYFTGPNGDLGWAKRDNPDPEFNAYVAENAKGGGLLVLGRLTYELMASYWPTPFAMQNDPIVAEGMNRLPKLVFSRTLDKAAWSNTTLVKQDLLGAVRRLKSEPGPAMSILGSGSLVSQLAPHGLIDEYQLVVNPVVLGDGRTMFDGLKQTLSLHLTRTRAFANGNVLLCYEPIT